MPNSALEARVLGVNTAHAYANAIWPKLADVCRPFIGKKVIIQSGDLIAKLKDAVEALNLRNDNKLHVYRDRSSMWIRYIVKTCVDFAGHAYYYEAAVYVADMEGGIMQDITHTANYKTDYDAAEVALLREQYKEKKKAADAAHSALHPFGERE